MDTFITSPFTKRKNKEQLQLQPQSQTAIPTLTSGIPKHVSSIPQPKKTTFHSFLPTSLLTTTTPQRQQQQQQQYNNNSNLNNSNNNSNNSISSSIVSTSSSSNISVNYRKQLQLNTNIEQQQHQQHHQNQQQQHDFLQTQFASSESSSGISSGSNKTTSNSSRSTSPTTSLESTTITTPNSEMNKQQIMKQGTSSTSKQQPPKKSGLPKGIPTKLQAPSVVYNTPTPSSSLNINPTQQQQQQTSSKLQSSSNSNIPSNNTTLKKFGTNKTGNLFGLNSKSTNNSQTNMPATLAQTSQVPTTNGHSNTSLYSTSTSSIKSNSNSTVKKTSNSNLSSTSTTSSNSSIGIPKLTKLNYDKNVNNNNENIESTTTSIRKLQYTSSSSKIPNCTVKKPESNLKPPTNIKTPTPTDLSTSSLQTPSKQPLGKPKLPAITDSTLMTKSMNSNISTINPNLVYSKLPNKLKVTTPPVKLTKPLVIENETAATVTADDDEKTTPANNIARVSPFKLDNNDFIEDNVILSSPKIINQSSTMITSTPTPSDDKDNKIALSNEQAIDIEEDSFNQNNNNNTVHLNENGYPSDKDLSTYARKIQKRFKDGIQAVKESMQFALSDEEGSTSTSTSKSPIRETSTPQIIIENNNSLYSQIHDNMHDKQQHQQHPLMIVPPRHDLIIQNQNKSQYQTLPNTFNRSNTLDRKLRQSFMQNEQQLQQQQQQQQQGANLSFKLFSSSLERNKHNQQQQLMMYQHQQQHQVYSSNRLSMTNAELIMINSNKNSKRSINHDTILENPNTIQFLSTSSEDLIHLNKNTKKLSYHEELLNKEKEILNLKLELESARNRILTMTNQLNTNAHIVTTLEQNLASLTLRAQTLAVHVQRRDKTINELKSYLEILCNKYPKVFENEKLMPLVRHNSTESMASLNSLYSQRSFQSTSEAESTNGIGGKKKRGNWLRSSFIRAFNRNKPGSGSKKLSSPAPPDTVDYSNCEITQNGGLCISGPYSLPNSPLHQGNLNNMNNCLMQSNGKLSNTINEDGLEDIQRQLREKESKLTDIQLEALASAHQLDQLKEECLKMKLEMASLKDENIRLKTTISLNNSSDNSSEYLNKSLNDDHSSSSASDCKKSPNRMLGTLMNDFKSNEMLNDKHSDTLLKRIEECKSLNHEIISQSLKETDGKRVLISIYHGDAIKLDDILDDQEKHVTIGSLSINTRIKWDVLDNVIQKIFKEYLTRLDSKKQRKEEPHSLGLSLDSIDHYYIGDILRTTKDVNQNPDLLPYGYLVGEYTNITICLKNASTDTLSFETLVPKNILQRYISLLTEYKHLLLCGQTGTGKSFIARRVGEHLMKMNNHKKNSIEYYNVENKSSKDLKQYLNGLIEQETLPYVLILDNLHNIANISDAFDEFFENKKSKKIDSFLIGTVNHPNITSLNIHENFKWVLCINHAEPVNNYLSRYLERSLIEYEIKASSICPELHMIVKWIPKLWQHLNKCIETYNSADVTLGPKLFTTMPLDKNSSKYWFIELWNQALVPYIIETILEGVQVYGSELKWEDPKLWILENSPWRLSEADKNSIRSIKANDVGCDVDLMTSSIERLTVNINIQSPEHEFLNEDIENEDFMEQQALSSSNYCSPSKQTVTNTNNSDNLINMLMRLQEVTMGNQKRILNENMIMNIQQQPQSVESAL